MGFSIITCLPASRADIVYGSWNSSEVRLKTTSTSLLVKMSLGFVVASGILNLAAQWSTFWESQWSLLNVCIFCHVVTFFEMSQTAVVSYKWLNIANAGR
jgi:hypothetical protein